ncbi:MAG: tetratricopeptide repeat protein [Deltaproteobacteria bacterium]|nr:tetratricopeptide repeat protein [Deltaproteobacteria bacterium]
MLKRRDIFPAIAVVMWLVFILPGCSSDVDKAKTFMDVGMYPQAIELLKKRISEKPDDAEAHFQLGVCYTNAGNFGGADERFESAVKLKSDYGFQIAGVYKKAGSDALNNGNSRQAMQLFRKAVKYQPDLKESIAKELFLSGKSYLDKQQSKMADSFLSMAVEYDPALKEQVDGISLKYGKKLLAMAKERPKKERKRYVDEALRFVSQKDVDEVLPPPTWKMVPGTYIEIEGKGLDTVCYGGKGISYEKGWRSVAVVEGDFMFKHKYGGRYNDYYGEFKLPIIKNFTVKIGLKFQISKNKIVKCWAERLETTY